MRPWLVLAFAGFSFCVIAASAQTRRIPPAFDCGKDSTTNRPFTLEFQLVDTKAGAGGELVTAYYSTDVIAQDSHGREMMIETMGIASRKLRGKMVGRVCDPVGQRQIMWDSDEKLAWVLAMPATDQRRGCWVSDSGQFTIDFDAANSARAAARSRALWESSITEHSELPANFEDLGTADFQGLEAHGYRSTSPPAGPGDPIPPYLVEEHWVAPSLGMWVKHQVDYPRREGSTVKWQKELTSYKPGKPAPSLFEVPEGFAIVNQSMHRAVCTRGGEVRSPQ
jgi:hypothetical protein